MHQSRKEKFGIHPAVTRLTLRDLIEKTDLWVCRYLPYSYKIFYKLVQQNSLTRSRSRLNHSPSMRYEVEFKSSRYLSSPDGSRDEEEPVLEHWCCPGWSGLSQVEKQFVNFAFLFLSCAKCSSAAVSTPPETLSMLAAWGPLQKSQKCKYDVLLPSAWPWPHKVSCQRAAWHQRAFTKLLGSFQREMMPKQYKLRLSILLPINKHFSLTKLNFPEVWGQVLHSQLYPKYQFRQLSANHLHLALQKELRQSLQEMELKSAKQEALLVCWFPMCLWFWKHSEASCC